MRTCSLLIASPSAGFLPRIAHKIKLPTNAWNSVAALSSSAANARASVIGATGLPVRGLVMVLQIWSSGIPRAFISLTLLRWSWVGSNFDRDQGVRVARDCVGHNVFQLAQLVAAEGLLS